MNNKGTINPRPYARLITMMGDQLIKNEKIALIELIKNSYDADATWVQVRFNAFESKDGNFILTPQSAIEIEDNGIGMTFDVIRDSWLNPASPYKYFKKRRGEDRTVKGRIMQGEKGIGRYAVFKLGDTVEIYSRSNQEASKEIYVKSDLSIYSSELTEKKDSLDFSISEFESQKKDVQKLCQSIKREGYGIVGLLSSENTIDWLNELLQVANLSDKIITKQINLSLPSEIETLTVNTEHSRKKLFKYLTDDEKNEIKRLNRFLIELAHPLEAPHKLPVFLDEIEYVYEINDEPQKITNREIHLRENKLVRDPYGSLIKISNLKSTWSENKIEEILQDCLKMVSPFNDAEFEIDIIINGVSKSLGERETWEDLLKMAPLRMTGAMDGQSDLTYSLNGIEDKILFNDIAQDKNVRKHFFAPDGNLKRMPHCGPFSFEFYVFDLDRKATLESPLDDINRSLIKRNRIYLYRDEIRVYPYGDPSDDWLELDILRGTQKAGSYLSNDQITGYIAISSKGNPDLRDKTNREGLMDIGNAYQDLKVLVLGILGFLNKEFKKYKDRRSLQDLEQKKKKGYFASEVRVENELATLLDYVRKSGDGKAENITKKLIKDYKKEYDFFKERLEIVEDLAAVGMTVEAASHDLMIMMERSGESLHGLLKMTEKNNFDYNKLRSALIKMQEQHNFIHDQMSGIQPLFRSARRESRSFNILNIIRTVTKYYGVPMEKRKITLSTREISGPLQVTCSEAILLQVFINLFDNAVYWLTTNNRDRKIEIVIDSKRSEVTFADSGPGVKLDDIPYIFEPFFSTKGIRGRGLGLYIAEQLLERSSYHISYISDNKGKLLEGANFLVSFNKTDVD